MVKAAFGVGVDDGAPEEDGGVLGLAEEGDGVVEAVEGGVGALELEVESWVVVEVVAEEKRVGLEEVVDGVGFVE